MKFPAAQARSAAVVAALISASPALAQAPVIGVGNTACSQVVSEIQTPAGRNLYLIWAGGFISGINLAGVALKAPQVVRDLSGLTADMIVSSLYAYCASNPNKPLVAAAEALHFSRPKFQ